LYLGWLWRSRLSLSPPAREAVEAGAKPTLWARRLLSVTVSGTTKVRTTIGLTVLAVRKGTHEELAEHGFEVDAESRDTTPYYVDARFENQGDQTIKRNLDVSLEDSDGNLIGRTLVFNYGNKPYKPCMEVTEGRLKPGESYESCTLFLVKEGVEVGKVSYLSDNGPDKEPEFVYWESE